MTFGKVPDKLMHSKISDGAIRVFAHIHWRAGDTGWFTEAPKTTANQLGTSVKTIRRRIKELEAGNWVAVINRPSASGKGNATNQIKPFQNQADCIKFRSAHKPKIGAIRPPQGYPSMDTGDHTPQVTIVTPDHTSMDTGDHRVWSQVTTKLDSLNQTPNNQNKTATPFNGRVVNFGAVKDSYDKKSKKWSGDYVYIGRYNRGAGLKKSDWHNPYKISDDLSREDVIAKYRDYLLNKPELLVRLPELGNKTLVCWCAPDACHGDVLAEFLDKQDHYVSYAQALIDKKQAEKQCLDDLFDAISWAWENTNNGYIARMRNFLTGQGNLPGKWGEFALKYQPASPVEVIAYKLYRRGLDMDSSLPTVPETIERTFLEFRGVAGYTRLLARAEKNKHKVFKRLKDQKVPADQEDTQPETVSYEMTPERKQAIQALDAVSSFLGG